MVEFVSYDGKWPSLCSGTLVLKVDGTVRTMLPYCMVPGGEVYVDEKGRPHIQFGPWKVRVPSYLSEYKEEIETCVNKNVRQGCCGGCIGKLYNSV